MTNTLIKTAWGITLCLTSLFNNFILAQSPTASITTWKDSSKAAFTIIHDDYSNYVPGIYQYAYPLATARGIKLSFGAITSACDSTEWANARKMIADGHECVNHSHTHHCGVCSSSPTCIAGDGNGNGSDCTGNLTYTTSNFATELAQSNTIIEQQTGKKPRFFAHPYDTYTSEILNYLKGLGYIGTRGGTRAATNTADFADPMHVNFYVWGPGNESTIEQLKASVDAAVSIGGYSMREFHDVGYPNGTIDLPWGNTPLTVYTPFLDYIKTKMDAGLIWSATASEAITYKMQREVYQPNVAYNATTGLIVVSFAANLANLKGVSPSLFTPSVFTTPITLKVNISGITNVLAAMATQNGVAIPYTRKGDILTMNIYPHNGPVTLNTEGACTTDVVKPVLSNCPNNITLTTTGTTAIATWTAPTATDNCTATPSVTGTYSSGSAFPIGTTNVVYTATDAKNNQSTCSFAVIVTHDSGLTGCDAIVVSDAGGAIGITGLSNLVILQVFDASYGLVYNQTLTTSSVRVPSLAAGTYHVSVQMYKVETGGGWTALCTKTVTMMVTNGGTDCTTDVTPPVFKNCPSNIALTTTGTTAIATWTAPTVTDNCTITPSITSTYNSGAVFPTGTTNVVYTATDAKNNQSTCQFSVAVTQNTGLSNCDALVVSSKSSAIQITGLTNLAHIQIFRLPDYSLVYNQTVTSPTVTTPVLSPGNYKINLKLFKVDPIGGSWSSLCERLFDVSVIGAQNRSVQGTDLAPIFPNPASHKFSIDLKSYTGEDITLSLFNSIGQSVLVQHLENVGDRLIETDVSKLNNGYYFVRIAAQGKADLVKQLYVAH